MIDPAVYLGEENFALSIEPALTALPPRKAQYPLYRRLGRPQGRSGRVRKIWPPPRFDPQTVQLVTSSYTN